MSILPQHIEWYEWLIGCCTSDIEIPDWWIIGEQMHTLTDDYKILYDYELAKEDLDKMWEAWKACDPRKKQIT